MPALRYALFHLYLACVTIGLLLPAAGAARLLRGARAWRAPTQGSYFSDVLAGARAVATYRTIRCYSWVTWVVLVVLTPCLWLGRPLERRLFNPAARRFMATPNQAAALVLSQLMGNVRGIAGAARRLGADYVFALQPTLMDTGPITEDDVAILRKRRETKIWGFPYTRFFEVYYARLREALVRDDLLRHHFVDVSRLFVHTKEQRLVDVTHMGDRAQEECARALAEEIARRCR